MRRGGTSATKEVIPVFYLTERLLMRSLGQALLAKDARQVERADGGTICEQQWAGRRSRRFGELARRRPGWQITERRAGREGEKARDGIVCEGKLQ